MTLERMIRPQFAKVFRGFNTKQVNDYITRLESELEIAWHQQERSGQETTDLQAEIERLKNQINVAWTEAETLRSKNSRLTASIQELEFSLQAEKDEQAHLRLELKQMKDAASDTTDDPQTIRNAILSAQRMGDMIVSEANQRAQELKIQADDAYAAAQEEMAELVRQKSAEADAIMTSAQLKCDSLQQDYDQILMDVSGFKAEMIGLYRKHLELLYKLPDNGMPMPHRTEPLLIECTESQTDIEFELSENTENK